MMALRAPGIASYYWYTAREFIRRYYIQTIRLAYLLSDRGAVLHGQTAISRGIMVLLVQLPT